MIKFYIILLKFIIIIKKDLVLNVINLHYFLKVIIEILLNALIVAFENVIIVLKNLNMVIWIEIQEIIVEFIIKEMMILLYLF